VKRYYLVITFLLIIYFSYSQQEIKEIFVSKINVTQSDKKILIEWENPENFSDYLNIYRSNSVINSSQSLKSATLIATLKNLENSYIDTPDYGEYYYAVIIMNRKDERENLIFIPFRNYTTTPVVITKEERWEIIRFSAQSNNKNISLEWDYKSDSDKKNMVMIYRNIVPITDDEILKNSIKIASVDIDDKGYIDYPIANINYYYAIFVVGEQNKKYQPNVNITIEPVCIKGAGGVFFDFSIDNFTPLPILSLYKDPATGKNFKDPQILKVPQLIKYNQRVESIISNDKKKFSDIYDECKKKYNEMIIPLQFHMLNDEELFEPKDYKIEYNRSISLIKTGDYNNALKTLEEILIENPPDYLKIRIAYYIATIYYITEDYYKSYIYYMLCFQYFRKETLPYINSISNILFPQLER